MSDSVEGEFKTNGEAINHIREEVYNGGVALMGIDSSVDFPKVLTVGLAKLCWFELLIYSPGDTTKLANLLVELACKGREDGGQTDPDSFITDLEAMALPEDLKMVLRTTTLGDLSAPEIDLVKSILDVPNELPLVVVELIPVGQVQ